MGRTDAEPQISTRRPRGPAMAFAGVGGGAGASNRGTSVNGGEGQSRRRTLRPGVSREERGHMALKGLVRRQGLAMQTAVRELWGCVCVRGRGHLLAGLQWGFWQSTGGLTG